MQGPVDVVVTGAAGFIGSVLVARLEAEGATVQGLDLRAGPSPTLHLDVTDGAEVMDVFRRLSPRVVVHAAAVVDDRGPAERFQQVNVAGTQNVLDAAAAARVERFVHLSSIAALGFDPGPDADQDTPLALGTGAPYFDTKAASEQLVRQAHAEGHVAAVVVRPGDVYGPGSVPWVDRPLGLMRRHVPVLIEGGRGLMAPCWVDNLVDALMAALSSADALGGVFQIHDGASMTYRDYFTRLAAAAGAPRPRLALPKALALSLAAGAEALQRAAGLQPAFTRGAVHYLCRRATYSLAASARVLGYRPAVAIDEAMGRLARGFEAARAARLARG